MGNMHPDVPAIEPTDPRSPLRWFPLKGLNQVLFVIHGETPTKQPELDHVSKAGIKAQSHIPFNFAQQGDVII